MLALAALLASLASGEAQPGAENPGVHGMLVFGSRVIYASHLPMFLPKHRYQALFEVSFGEEGDARYRAERERAGPAAVFTLEPKDTFRMTELTGSRTTFKADLFLGHFERPGHKPILEAATVTLRRRAAWHPFRRSHPRPESLTYLIEGSPGDLYLVHWIARAPDFDQVLAVTAATPMPAGSCQFVIAGRADDAPLRPGERVSGLVTCDRGAEEPARVAPLELRVAAQVYLERDELTDDGLDAEGP